MSSKEQYKNEIVNSGLIPEEFLDEASDSLSKYDELEREVKKREEANQIASSYLDMNQVFYMPVINF